MSWQDRDYADDPGRTFGTPGGDWRGLRPSFDNPFSWSFSIGRISRIDVRIHLLFVVFIVIMLLRAIVPPSQGQTYTPINLTLMAVAMVGLFGIVLLHEFGHSFACRFVGGEADEILLWPLGGLAFNRPPNHWKAHLITVVGGPLVNVVICAVLGIFLGTLTGRWLGVALPNPLTLAGLYDPTVSASLVYQAMFLINSTSLILLLFNLLPIFPLDGGRIVQSLLWPRVGYTRSMTFAIRTGYVGAIALVIFGAVVANWPIVGVAIFGAVSCYMKQQQLKYTDAVLAMESEGYSETWRESAEAKKPTIDRKAEKIAQREQQEAQEVDRILQKIADTGIDSLSRSERALLKRVTERKRQNG